VFGCTAKTLILMTAPIKIADDRELTVELDAL
jgi:hypothetical protein